MITIHPDAEEQKIINGIIRVACPTDFIRPRCHFPWIHDGCLFASDAKRLHYTAEPSPLFAAVPNGRYVFHRVTKNRWFLFLVDDGYSPLDASAIVPKTNRKIGVDRDSACGAIAMAAHTILNPRFVDAAFGPAAAGHAYFSAGSAEKPILIDNGLWWSLIMPWRLNVIDIQRCEDIATPRANGGADKTKGDEK